MAHQPPRYPARDAWKISMNSVRRENSPPKYHNRSGMPGSRISNRSRGSTPGLLPNIAKKEALRMRYVTDAIDSLDLPPPNRFSPDATLTSWDGTITERPMSMAGTIQSNTSPAPGKVDKVARYRSNNVAAAAEVNEELSKMVRNLPRLRRQKAPEFASLATTDEFASWRGCRAANRNRSPSPPRASPMVSELPKRAMTPFDEKFFCQSIVNR